MFTGELTPKTCKPLFARLRSKIFRLVRLKLRVV